MLKPIQSKNKNLLCAKFWTWSIQNICLQGVSGTYLAILNILRTVSVPLMSLGSQSEETSLCVHDQTLTQLILVNVAFILTKCVESSYLVQSFFGKNIKSLKSANPPYLFFFFTILFTPVKDSRAIQGKE